MAPVDRECRYKYAQGSWPPMHQPELAKVSCRRGPRTGAARHCGSITIKPSALSKHLTYVAGVNYLGVRVALVQLSLPITRACRAAWAGITANTAMTRAISSVRRLVGMQGLMKSPEEYGLLGLVLGLCFRGRLPLHVGR